VDAGRAGGRRWPATPGARCQSVTESPWHGHVRARELAGTCVWKLVHRDLFGPLKQILPELKNFCRFAHL
jgi:hypothetical protein